MRGSERSLPVRLALYEGNVIKTERTLYMKPLAWTVLGLKPKHVAVLSLTHFYLIPAAIRFAEEGKVFISSDIRWYLDTLLSLELACAAEAHRTAAEHTTLLKGHIGIFMLWSAASWMQHLVAVRGNSRLAKRLRAKDSLVHDIVSFPVSCYVVTMATRLLLMTKNSKLKLTGTASLVVFLSGWIIDVFVRKSNNVEGIEIFSRKRKS